MTTTKTTYNYNLTLSGAELPGLDSTWFMSIPTKAQLINAVAMIEDISNVTVDEGTPEGWEPFAEKFSPERRHDISKEDLYQLLSDIEKVILNFKPTGRKTGEE